MTILIIPIRGRKGHAVLVYLDGQYLPAHEAKVSVFDGGFLYGDGVYTTLRLYRGRPVELAAHWRRLCRHARALELPLTGVLSLAGLRTITERLADANLAPDADGRLRITVSRGGGPGLSPPGTATAIAAPTALVTLAPVPVEIAGWQEDGIGVTVLGPLYARAHFPELKTLNGLPSVLAQREAARRGCPEALLTDPDGRLLEGSVSNIFLVRAGRIGTPLPAGRFLPGLTRRRILEIVGGLGIPCRQTNLTTADLGAADEVFVASSVREVLPVVRVDGRPVGDGRPGALTRLVQHSYRRYMQARLRA